MIIWVVNPGDGTVDVTVSVVRGRALAAPGFGGWYFRLGDMTKLVIFGEGKKFVVEHWGEGNGYITVPLPHPSFRVEVTDLEDLSFLDSYITLERGHYLIAKLEGG